MSEVDFVVAIPARYGASRLPGKPLRLIAGLPMVVHVARRALTAGAREVVVATDDVRIAQALAGEPLLVCMTRADHLSGTDRLAECAAQRGWPDEQIVVNLQGDEPFAPPEGIRAVALTLAAGTAEMATLCAPVEDLDTLFDPNAVKVVRDSRGLALYFSRAPIPWQRDRFARERLGPDGGHGLRHIGIYAYRAGFLRQFAALAPSPLEQAEALEQLRVLEAGFRIAVGLTPAAFPPGVDTEADLARAQALAERTVPPGRA
jgi:3-deoxy-manno-octulosonate cytidylyltransferase (CMP-KDO synthetase)